MQFLQGEDAMLPIRLIELQGMSHRFVLARFAPLAIGAGILDRIRQQGNHSVGESNAK
ncbi:MAG: hypothetical protein H6922_02830 [Pseudomonadaceae bacterium]|nr:hypothetical protein [Pseudomonadaceae bacterium]